MASLIIIGNCVMRMGTYATGGWSSIGSVYPTQLIVVDDSTSAIATTDVSEFVRYTDTTFDYEDLPVAAQRVIVRYARVWHLIMFMVIWRRLVEARGRAPPGRNDDISN